MPPTFPPDLESSRRTYLVVKAKAPDALHNYLPYLRAAVPYYRALEEGYNSQECLEACIRRIECEESFRTHTGRAYDYGRDHLSYEDALKL